MAETRAATSMCDIWLGVSVGKGTVVAANSVVIRDIPPKVVVAGVPAKPNSVIQ